MAYMMARAKKGSIGSLTSRVPILVTYFDFGSMAPIN